MDVATDRPRPAYDENLQLERSFGVSICSHLFLASQRDSSGFTPRRDGITCRKTATFPPNVKGAEYGVGERQLAKDDNHAELLT